MTSDWDEEYDDEPVALGTVVESLEEAAAVQREKIAEDAWAVVNQKEPLYVMDSERNILGAILLRPAKTFELVVDIGLTTDDFLRRAHRYVFETALKLFEEDEHVDTFSVVDELNRKGVLDEVGGAAFVSQLEATMPEAEGTSYSIRLVMEKAKLRGISAVLRQALEKTTLGKDAEEIIDDVERGLTFSKNSSGQSGFDDNVIVTQKALDLMPAFNGGVIPGISTGFVDVDGFFRYKPGDLVICAGRPGMGKTQFALDSSLEVGLTNGGHVAFFSLEMSSESLMTRLIASKAGHNTDRRHIPRHEVVDIQGAAGMLSGDAINIADTPGITLAEVRSKARKLHRKKKLSLLVIDYLQLMTIPDQENRAAAFGEISKGLKQLARELECPVMALSQLNRGVESRSDKRPLMSDIRESGAIEQDADIIIFLYREEYYAGANTAPDDIGTGELIIGKNRNGPTGVVKLTWQSHIPRYRSYQTPQGRYP